MNRISRSVFKSLCFIAISLGFIASAPAQLEQKKYGADYREEEVVKPWSEGETAFPDYPKAPDLIEFYVSATTQNKFYIDGRTLSVGEDNVVRYAVVIKTQGSTSNTSFEGMRCETGEQKLYATGSDPFWRHARTKDWAPIRSTGPNAYQRVLYKEYFCPFGEPIKNNAEGVSALKRGGHPSVR